RPAATTSPASLGGDGGSSDDGLTLYLAQMGVIPLLDPTQEREVAARLDAARRRYRRAALWNCGNRGTDAPWPGMPAGSECAVAPSRTSSSPPSKGNPRGGDRPAFARVCNPRHAPMSVAWL